MARCNTCSSRSVSVGSNFTNLSSFGSFPGSNQSQVATVNGQQVNLNSGYNNFSGLTSVPLGAYSAGNQVSAYSGSNCATPAPTFNLNVGSIGLSAPQSVTCPTRVQNVVHIAPVHTVHTVHTPQTQSVQYVTYPAAQATCGTNSCGC